MQTKVLTVIIPTHNSEKFISECVKSVMNQTYKNLQIICVDSSSDNTISILKELQQQDSRIEIIQDVNGSYGHKLNIGIQYAKGDYIGIVESDDYVLPEMYEVLLSDMPETDIDYIKCSQTNHFLDVSGRRIFNPEGDLEVEKYVNRVIDLEQNRSLAFLNLPRIWTAIYRRAFLLEKNIQANETPGASYQDTSFTQAVAFLASKCMYKSGAYYCYRNDNPNSSVKSDSKIFCVCDEYKHLERLLRRNDAYTDEVRIRMLKLKAATYYWNIRRLTEKSAEEFWQGIQEEMQAYTPEVLNDFSVNERKLFDMLTRKSVLKQASDEFEQVLQNWQAVLHVLDNKECVLVGAGKIGQNVLWTQNIMQKNSILAVADNNYMQIKCVDDYKVEALETVAVRYPYAVYLVANKLHGEEIKTQLVSYGIKPENMLFLNASLGRCTIMSEVAANSHVNLLHIPV